MRLFVSLDVPEALKEALGDVQDDLGVGRMVPEENLHLTLAFLDHHPPQVAEAVHEALSGIRAPQVRLEVRGTEVVGGKRPALLAAMVEPVPELVHLHDKVAQAVRMAGVDLPRRRFRPHVTLVRFPNRLPDFATDRIAAWLADFGDMRMNGGLAQTFSLYQSTLREDGPIYDALACYPLEP